MEAPITEHISLDLGAIAKRLRWMLADLDLSATEFAHQAEVAYSTFRAYTAGDGGTARPPSTEFLASVFLRWGYMPSWILTGVGPRKLDDVGPAAATAEEFVVVPQLDVAASAGPGAINSTELRGDGLSFSRAWLSKRGLNPVNLRVIAVSGESMEGKLSDGDKVLVDITDTRPKSGRAYVLLQGEELLVKYCQLLPTGQLRVSSENKHYPTYDIDLATAVGVSIVGRVVASTHEW